MGALIFLALLAGVLLASLARKAPAAVVVVAIFAAGVIYLTQVA